jgi:hypothetical protein
VNGYRGLQRSDREAGKQQCSGGMKNPVEIAYFMDDGDQASVSETCSGDIPATEYSIINILTMLNTSGEG